MSVQDNQYVIRRKVLTIAGQQFHVYDGHGQLLGYSRQKAFKLKEDIRFYADETMAEEKLLIQARQVIDFAAAYDVVDSQTGSKVGACRRKGWSSVMRDSWELLDEDDRPIAKVQEDSALMAFLRRFLSNLIPQHYHIADNAGVKLADMRVRFNPFVYKMEVSIADGVDVNRALVLAAGILLAAIEGRQK
ncbi:MAG: LURP-one-related/scramblase family protein [Planctomycetota bacterium]|jgi:hypothetical protein